MGLILAGESNDGAWMERALHLAERAAAQGEIPVGAVLVLDGTLTGEGWNRPIGDCDPTAHAEIVALRDAARRIGNYRLPGATLYCTLEPCLMCVGAIIHARLARVVFAALDPKSGACGSVFDTLSSPLHNHRVTYEAGVCGERSSLLLRDFFQARR